MSYPSRGFAVPDFLSTDSWQEKISINNLLCLSCDRIFRDPVQTLCGHGYCKGCLIRILWQVDCTVPAKRNATIRIQFGEMGPCTLDEISPGNHGYWKYVQYTTP